MLTAEGFQAQTGATVGVMDRLERFRALLAAANEDMNLIGPATLPDFWNRHALDSWQLLVSPEGKAASTWADIGAGAGLPGIVVACFLAELPSGRILLIDSLTKRCRFLASVVSALDLRAEIVNDRAENVSAVVDVVTARAVAPLDRLLAYAQPMMARGAQAVFLKGEKAEEELKAARKSWQIEAELSPSLSDPRGRLVHVRSARRVR